MKNSLAVAILMFCQWGLASEPVQSYDQVKSIYKKYESAKGKVTETEVSARKIMGTLYQLRSRIRKMSTQRDRLSAEVSYLNGNIKVYTQQLNDLENKIKKQKVELAKRLKAIYLLGDSSVMNLILSSLNQHEIDQSMYYLKKVSEYDIRLINEFKESQKKFAKKKLRLKKKINHMANLKVKIAENEKLLKKDSFTKKVLLSKLEKEKKKYLSELHDIKNEGREIELEKNQSSLANLFKDSFFEKRGSLSRPVNGPVQIPFGMYKDEEYEYKLSQKGIFISAHRGSKITSVHSGRVSYLGVIRGFGKTMIIDHGDNYYTVYSGLEDVVLKVGDLVKSNEVIAATAYVPSLKNNGLYFEIRHFSEALNPNNWLKRLN